MFQRPRARQTNKQANKKQGVRQQEISDVSIPTYTPPHQFPKLKTAEPIFFFFSFQIWWKNILPSQAHMCQFSTQKEFLDAGEKDWNSRFIIEVPSQKYLSWAGTAQ